MKYLNIPVNSSCPVCCVARGRILYKVQAVDAVRHFRLEKPDKDKYFQLIGHIKNLWKSSECSVIMCDNCEFCYSYPYIGGDNIFYNLAYERTGYPDWKFEFDKTIDQLQYLIKSKGIRSPKLMEIAAGNGSFLKALVPQLISSSNIYCTEYSEYGINELEKLGVNVINEDFREFSGHKFKSYFDVICLFQVLEHLDDLKKTFEALSYITKKGSHIFIAVPNPNMIQFNEKNGALLDMPPNHVGRWTFKSFQIVAKDFNWDIVDYQIEKSIASKALDQFCYYKYLKNSQRKNTIENILESYKTRLFSNRFYSLKQLIINSYRKKYKIKVEKESSELGNTQWIYFIKK